MNHKKMWLGFLILFFVVLPALRYSGGWALFWLPFVFFWFFAGSSGHRRGHKAGWCGSGWHHHDWHDKNSPGKRKQKPKRDDHDYIETADGDYLEVIDEPRSV